MMRGRILIAFAVLCRLLLSPAEAAVMPKACEAPDDVLGVVTPLPNVAAVLKPGSTLHILAIGSVSVFGPEASRAPGTVTAQTVTDAATGIPIQILSGKPSRTAFPQRMADALEAAVPGLHVAITAHGGRGLTAADQLGLLADALKPPAFNLVIWQTGTVEAVRNLSPSEFAETLADGVALAERSGADIVLIDPQFSRFLQTNSNIEPYEDVFEQLGSIPGVLLFHRYDLMRNWVNDGQIDLERTPKPNRNNAIEQLDACLGSQLSRIILRAAHS